MPSGRGTPVHTVRIPEDMWEAARASAKQAGLSGVGALLRELLERHLAAEKADRASALDS